MKSKRKEKEIIDENIIENKEEKIKTEESKDNFVESETDDINKRFEQFSKQSAEFSPEPINEGTEIANEKVSEESGLTTEEIQINRNIKIKMFVGFACFVLAGLNMFILNKIRSANVPFEKMAFTDSEKESLLPYMDDPRVLNFIDKIPSVLLMVLHVEYLMFAKHDLWVNEYKVIKPKKDKK